MKSLISENEKVLVASDDSLFAARCGIIEINDDTGFSAGIMTGKLPDSGSCDVFAPVKSGLLFFSTDISENDGNKVKFSGFRDVETIQRREFSRTYSGKNILIAGNNGEIIHARILDISAGGMKIEINKKIDIGIDLDLNFNLNKSVAINCQFTPLSQSSDENTPDKFIVSGKFKNMKPSDIIILCRYCATEILKQKSLDFDDNDN